jgi:hypothetical protein
MHAIRNTVNSYICDRITASGGNASRSGNSGEERNVIQ